MNKRLGPDQAIQLSQTIGLCALGEQAAAACQRLHHTNVRTYVVERNINYTNVCSCRCSFCAFSVSPGDAQGYVLTLEQVLAKIEELDRIGGTQILLQGGMNPELPFVWYEKLLKGIKQAFPNLHIHAFSPAEIVFLANQCEMPQTAVLDRLHAAGLDSLPGGGAEILVDRVRRAVAPAKCSTNQWLAVMETAHALGICTTATMMFGHVETLAERVEHLDRIRQLQDASLEHQAQYSRRGCFTAFTCWPFQPGQTRLARVTPLDHHKKPAQAQHRLQLAHAAEQLKMTALGRIYLDNIPNIQASWVTQGPRIGQLSLMMGCNDMGSVMMEENVVAAAGTRFDIALEDLKALIKTAGFEPRQRDYYYRQVPEHPKS